MGGSMSGYSLRGNIKKATIPKVTINKLITVAKTGLFTDKSDKITSFDSS
jgi:hypothetical protein